MLIFFFIILFYEGTARQVYRCDKMSIIVQENYRFPTTQIEFIFKQGGNQNYLGQGARPLVYLHETWKSILIWLTLNYTGHFNCTRGNQADLINMRLYACRQPDPYSDISINSIGRAPKTTVFGDAATYLSIIKGSHSAMGKKGDYAIYIPNNASRKRQHEMRHPLAYNFVDSSWLW